MTSGERSVVSISSRNTKPDHACGDRAEQHRPGEPALADLAALRDRQHPIARHRRERGAEVDDDGHQGAEVDRHIELEPLVGPVREIGHENQVARARNRQELSDSLDDGEDDDVQRIHETRPGNAVPRVC